ncbi:hypothetical protein IAI53_00285 [Thauera sp. CAU 1555]|uniref:Uncharacterized protein n=1 Tax=Thauera sedimentorum TaxID=2767595 RepID=A0ABR9B783_9RHOO|nr:hypothetical protein [Thauera sedimentorum]MBD8501320.1 hypothetical protein [Thauera sedimentorum]
MELAYRHAGFLFRGMGHYEMWRQRGVRGIQAEAAAGLVDLTGVAPLAVAPGRVAVHAHVFYPELAAEFSDSLRCIPFEFHLFVSVPDSRAETTCRKVFKQLPRLAGLRVEVVPNRGRDIAPMLCTFGQALSEFDFIAHIHSKRSLYNRGATDGWRDYLLGSLFGSEDRVRRIFSLLTEGAGMVFPQCYAGVPYVASTWLANREQGAAWCHRLGVGRVPRGYFDFPVGSMFWARSDVLRPLLNSGVQLNEFDEEAGQTDGTLAHVMERLLGVVARSSGKPLAILRDELRPSWSVWRFEQSVQRTADAARAVVSAADVRLVVFDVFDTLLHRPLLEPEQIKHIVARRVGGELGSQYLRWRAVAENSARARVGRDVDLSAIFEEMADLAGLSASDVDVLTRIEHEVELAAVSAREDYRRLLSEALRAGKRVVLASDMYLPRRHVELMLQRCGVAGWHALYVSSEVGVRKDSGALYDHLLAMEAVRADEVLVIGDNERSDFQIPADRGMRTLHVLRAVELARALPRMAPLVEMVEDSALPDADLALGLIVQRFFSPAFFDRFDSTCLVGEAGPRALGYAIAGPLALSFVQWLAVRAEADGVRRLYFLAREGQFLLEVFRRYSAVADKTPSAAYLVVSRRAVNVPAISGMDDMLAIARTFYGPSTLDEYVRERFGVELDESELQSLHDRGLWRKGRKVEVRDEDVDELLPVLEALLPRVMRQVAEEHGPLMSYLKGAGLDGEGRVAVVDIGYSGTIQRRLNVLLGRDVHGYYMATDERAAGVASEHGVLAEGCFHDQAKPAAAGPPLIAQSFIAEKLFSSDDPQVVRYEFDSYGHPQPVHRALAPAELATRAVRAEIRAGALEFVDDALRARTELLPDFTVPPQLASRLFESFVEQTADAERAVINELILDDHYCGRGLVA